MSECESVERGWMDRQYPLFLVVKVSSFEKRVLLVILLFLRRRNDAVAATAATFVEREVQGGVWSWRSWSWSDGVRYRRK